MTRLLTVGLLAFVLGMGFAHQCQRAGAQSQEVESAMHSAAVTHGVSEGWLRRVAWCESRWRPWVDNTQGSGAQGLFQFMPRTWRWMSSQAGWAGASPYDPWAASHVAAWAFRNGYASHWSCR